MYSDLIEILQKPRDLLYSWEEDQLRQWQMEKYVASRPSGGGRPELFPVFSEVLTARTSDGEKFTLHDGSLLRSSLRKKGERVSAQVMRWALWKIWDGYEYHSVCGRSPRMPRVQHLALRFAEVLAFQDLVHPDVSCIDLRLEAAAALFAVLDALEKFVDDPLQK